MSIHTAASRRGSAMSIIASAFACAASTFAQPVTITVDPSKITHELTPYMTGVCLEDVNHEIYGGLYSQMIYGESFQEPAPASITGFQSYEGRWSVDQGALRGEPSMGGKLMLAPAADSPKRVSVRIRFPDDADGNAGLILNVRNPRNGADAFEGFEVSLDPRSRTLRLARHDNNYVLIRDVPCEVPPNRWITLETFIAGRTLTVWVDGNEITKHEDDRVALGGNVGLRTWRRAALFGTFSVVENGASKALPFLERADDRTSAMWRPVSRGQATGAATTTTTNPFIGNQSQTITFREGDGFSGIENSGLNRSGMDITAGKPCTGYFWARTDKPTPVTVAFAPRSADTPYATSQVTIDGGWKRYDFTLTPSQSDPQARFEIGLTAPGSVTLGHALVSPGPWATFAGLPVRADVAAAMQAQAPKVIRYGGSMINSGEYRWKKMIGPRDRRPPYTCVWDPHATNGWAIPDFLNFAEAMGVLAIPAFNIDESPQDMADFLEYANGDATTPYGAKRAQDGHPAPYNLTHLELGNEERVDDTYYRKFEAIARALWARNPKLILTVGDFCYTKPITDPFKFDGADSGITTLAAHQKILSLAKELNTEVWFDIHIWTDRPSPADTVRPWKTYIDQITTLGEGVKHKVVVYELNANAHTQHRALANAQILLELERDGRVPVVITANALQVDGQNDDGWNQGLIFMNTTKVWAQPPSLLWQLASTSTHPKVAATTVSGGPVDALATLSADGTSLSVQILNLGDTPRPIELDVKGRDIDFALIRAETLAAPLDASNTAQAPESVKIRPLDEKIPLEVPPHSFTVLRYKLP